MKTPNDVAILVGVCVTRSAERFRTDWARTRRCEFEM